MRDQFVEMRLRQENHNLGYCETLKDGLTPELNVPMSLPSTEFTQALNKFLDSLSELSRNPESDAK